MKTSKMMTMLLTAATLIAVPGAAMASDEARARDAIAEADARIEAAWAAGAGERAPGIQYKATTALDRARHQLRRSKEHRAYYAAREADAYAQLALAMAQNRR